MTTRAGIEFDAVIVACAVSTGVHAAFTPDHIAEGTAAGLGFLAATILLATVVALLIGRPNGAALTVTVALLAALIVSYALAATSGLPLLHPEPEPINGLAVVTKVIEGLGLLAAIDLLRARTALVRTPTRSKGLPA